MSLSIGLVRDSDGVVRFMVVGEFTTQLARELEKNQECLTDGLVIEVHDSPGNCDLRCSLDALRALIGLDTHLCQAFEFLLHKHMPKGRGMTDGILVRAWDVDEDRLPREVGEAVPVLETLFETVSMEQAFRYVLQKLEPLGTDRSRRSFSAETLYAHEAQGRRPDPIPGCEDLDNDPQRRTHN